MDLFQKNLERWAILNPQYAQELKSLTCQSTKIKEDSGFIVLSKNNKIIDSTDPREAASWFKSLDLNGIQILYVFGVGLGSYYEVAKEWLTGENNYLVFLEHDLEIIHKLFETEQGTTLLNNKKVRICYLEVNDPYSPSWQMASLPFCIWDFKTSALKSYEQDYPELLSTIFSNLSYWQLINQASLAESFNFGQIFYKNYYSNLFELPTSYLGNALLGRFSGVPAIICGAGPSLNKNLQLLETLKDRALIFAGGTSMNAVTAKGFLPHFGLGIDPNPPQIARLLANQAFEVPFIYRGRVNHEALNLIQAPKIFITGAGGHKIADRMEQALGIPGTRIEEGYNVVNFSMSLAIEMGCNPIILVGLDLAYTNNQSYSQGVSPHAIHLWRKDFKTKDIFDDLMETKDIYGKSIHTLWKWVVEARWISDLKILRPNINLINATEGGIGMPGVPNIPLNEVAKEFFNKPQDLSLLVHGEMQNSRMPTTVTTEKIVSSLNQILESLKRCAEHFEKILIQVSEDLEKLEKDLQVDSIETVTQLQTQLEAEPAFENLILEFLQGFLMAYDLEMQNILYDPALNQKERNVRKKQMEARLYYYLKAATETQSDIIEKSLQHHAASQTKQRSPQVTPDQEHQNEEIPHGENEKTNYPNGQCKSIMSYQNGQLHGPSRFYSESGTLLGASSFVHGKKEGAIKYYYYDGRLYSSQYYRDGKKEGREEYYFYNGSLKTSLSYKEGLLDGEVLLYYPNGQTKREIHYKLGRRDGKERLWNENGSLILEAVYREDKPIQTAHKWHENGQLAIEIIYNDESQAISTKEWLPDGSLLPANVMMKEDFFDAVSRQTGDLTRSLETVFNHLQGVSSVVSPLELDPDLQNQFSDLKKEIEHLEKISSELLEETGLTSDNSSEAIWKGPSARREVQKHIEEMTSKLTQDLNLMQEIIKRLEEDEGKNT